MSQIDAPMTIRPFAYIADRRTAAVLAEMAAAIAADEEARELTGNGQNGRLCTLADITLRISTERGVRLHSIYWSVQRRCDGAGHGFAARTLSYDKASGRLAWQSFPCDRDLRSLEAVLARSRNPSVMRYVPFRRATLRCEDGRGRSFVTKVKRAKRYQRAADVLRTVSEIVACIPVSFRVARLEYVEAENRSFTQSLCEGTSLSEIITVAEAPQLLRRVGRMHAELHALPYDKLPQGASGLENFVQAQQSALWITHLLPQHADRIAACLAAMKHQCPHDEAPVFCHGDFSCDQILVSHEGSWSLVDFELCHRGSRYRDMAIWLATLPSDIIATAAARDVANLRALADAEAAYLESYATHAGSSIDVALLSWHRACAELERLKFMLKKDRYRPLAFADGMLRLERACALL